MGDNGHVDIPENQTRIATMKAEEYRPCRGFQTNKRVCQTLETTTTGSIPRIYWNSVCMYNKIQVPEKEPFEATVCVLQRDIKHWQEATALPDSVFAKGQTSSP